MGYIYYKIRWQNVREYDLTPDSNLTIIPATVQKEGEGQQRDI